MGRMVASSWVLDATLDRLVARFGDRALTWWADMPETVERLAGRWELEVGDPVGRGNTSLVLRAIRADGRRAMLKLGPVPAIGMAEGRALRSWSRSGRTPRLWAADSATGALLLEALPDERPVGDHPQPPDLRAVAELIRALHEGGPPPRVESLADRVGFIFDHWIPRYCAVDRCRDVVGQAELERGRALAVELATDASAGAVLLHGDLHPGNLLDGGPERGLVAIDPRPCVGDPAFDAIDFVFWATDDPSTWAARETELAGRLGCDRDRLHGWGVAFAALLAAGETARGSDPAHAQALLALAA
jgi:streptomycin 6-kinase